MFSVASTQFSVCKYNNMPGPGRLYLQSLDYKRVFCCVSNSRHRPPSHGRRASRVRTVNCMGTGKAGNQAVPAAAA